MPIFEITEIDRDYRARTRTEMLEFESLAEANEYCTKESWTGYDYFVTRQVGAEIFSRTTRPDND